MLLLIPASFLLLRGDPLISAVDARSFLRRNGHGPAGRPRPARPLPSALFGKRRGIPFFPAAHDASGTMAGRDPSATARRGGCRGSDAEGHGHVPMAHPAERERPLLAPVPPCCPLGQKRAQWRAASWGGRTGHSRPEKAPPLAVPGTGRIPPCGDVSRQFPVLPVATVHDLKETVP